ncbi:prolyl oligopeptidase family serine peptidase [Halomonas denitrificans]|nr:prolyl oligopeptidase family serine peptidase [Halomonas denitrificans]
MTHPITNRVATAAAALLLAATASAETPDLKQIMADPDWIGPPVEAAWWQLDGERYFARVKRPDSQVRDLLAVTVPEGSVERLETADLAAVDGPQVAYDRDRDRALSIRDGNVFLHDLAEASRTQLTATGDAGDVRFGAEEDAALVRLGRDWYGIELATGLLRPLADLRFENEPDADPDEGSLQAHQLELFETLDRERRQRIEQRMHDLAVADADASRAPQPFYLGKGKEPLFSQPSADGRWMLVAVREEGADDGRDDKMPRFVTESGYVEIEDVRTLVGRDAPTPQQLWLLDLDLRVKHELDFSALEGIDVDPLADLKAEQDVEPYDADDPRPLVVTGVEWHPTRSVAAVQVEAIDNKDRWTVRIVPGDDEDDEPGVTELHRLTDPAWINWSFNEFGWVPGGDTLWLLSEESGYSHLYTIDRRGRQRAVTEGEFEVYAIGFAGDPDTAWALSNRAHPTEYDLYSIELPGGDMTQLTELKGVEDYALSPAADRILIRHSGSYLPAQAAVVPVDGGEPFAATDTRTDDYKAIDWQEPRFVAVPSSHVDGPIWSKFYPARGEFEGPRPAVLFVHGAGYTQNTHHRFPYYFREQMFHNLLTARGYHVLDMDYRASRGYGRDWRTAIYRRMGTPELEDLVDGVEWLVENHDVDPDRVGVYGGSYGGFMTFMAMFNAPEVFAAGAALRPVTDWKHYNHPYTSNILNTPDVDPEAYDRSSPIEFVEGLEGDLLISHGMLDDNVFYKDAIRLVQRLIELEKEDWELASYPLEPHGYVHPESWLDQYRRILKLFEESIGGESAAAGDGA